MRFPTARVHDGTKRQRAASLALALLTALSLLTLAPATRATTRPHDFASGTYTNPIIAQTAPDPAVIKALDGYYYLVATSDYWQDGSFHLLPIWRSTDLVNWTFVGDSFSTRPAWVDPTVGLWAPDLQYYNHKYFMYYTAPNTNPLPAYGTTGGSAIGVATADSPAGPWTDMGPSAGGSYTTGPIVPPRPCTNNTDPNCYHWSFDPAEFTNSDGQKYLYYGSYYGGTIVQKLTADGLHTQGPAIQIGHWDRYEGTYIIRHDVNGKTYYYNFSSTADCCRGPNTAYSVVTNRATSPMGPFVDQNGVPMLQPGPAPVPTGRNVYDPAAVNSGDQGGGFSTLKQNGNRWHGVGHNAIIVDLSGHDWIVYHGVDKNNGWVNSLSDPNAQITFRQGLIDRIDWDTNGWPVTNGGAGPSDGPEPAPVTAPLFGNNFNNAGGCAAPPFANTTTFTPVSGTFTIAPGTCVTGSYGVVQGLSVSSDTAPPGSRVECDVRLESGPTGRYGCVVSYASGSFGGTRYIAVSLDPTLNALVTDLYGPPGMASGAEQVTPLPSGFDHGDWHHLTIDQDLSIPGRAVLRVTVSDRNRDPLAVQARALPEAFARSGGAVGAIAQGGAQADVDNVTVARLNNAPVPAQSVPLLGALLPAYSDKFNGSLGPQWSWIREDATRHGFVNGQLSILANGDLYRDANNASNLLVETPPPGDYTVETKITFGPTQNYHQAGLLIYSDDDHYIKVGPAHLNSLSKTIAGYEDLQPLPAPATQCDVQPSPTSLVAVMHYTRDLCPNEGESWDYLTNPRPTANDGPNPGPAPTEWLRVYKTGNTFTAFASLDDVNWVKGVSWVLAPVDVAHPIRIGLFAFWGGSHDPASTPPALFDYVRVYGPAGSSGSSSAAARP